MGHSSPPQKNSFALFVMDSIAPIFLYPCGSDRLRHGVRNFVSEALNAGVNASIFFGVWWTAANWAVRNGFGLLHWIA